MLPDKAGTREFMVVLLFLAALLSGCTTPFQRPAPFDDTPLRARAKTVAGEGIRVSAAIPSPEESRTIFGIDLEKKGIQPLWLEIENDTDRLFTFLETGLDPWYFSPLEVSFLYHAWFSDTENAHLDEHIQRLHHKLVIDPHSKKSGFVYTNQDEFNKFVSVDLVGREWTRSFTLVVPISGGEIGREAHRDRFLQSLARPGNVEAGDESHLRELLEKLPCCAASMEGARGEPINLVFVGHFQDVIPAFIRRNFRYMPADPRFLFQQPQDISVSKRDLWDEAQPHLLRMWLTAIRLRGKHVWVAQVSSPLGGRFSRAGEGSEAQRIDPDVDEARFDLVQELIYSQHVARIGFVQGVGQVMASSPRTLPGGGSYYTDGIRAVLFFEPRPVPLSAIEFLEWERPVDHYRKQVDGGESKTAP